MNTLNSGQVWAGDYNEPDSETGDGRNHPQERRARRGVVRGFVETPRCGASAGGEPLHRPADLLAVRGARHDDNSGASIQFLQTPTEVAILYERDHFTRIVHLDQQHTAHPAPSWFGESVGHYEGDTLVVDTIGFNGKSAVDRFGSPSSEALHVVERFHVQEGRRMLEVDFTVEDPNVFTMPWSAVAMYRRNNNPAMEEVVCAEGNYDVTHRKDFPIPMQN